MIQPDPIAAALQSAEIGICARGNSRFFPTRSIHLPESLWDFPFGGGTIRTRIARSLSMRRAHIVERGRLVNEYSSGKVHLGARI